MIATFMPTYLSLFTGGIYDREGGLVLHTSIYQIFILYFNTSFNVSRSQNTTYNGFCCLQLG